GAEAQRRTDPAGNWRSGIVFAIVGFMAGSRRDMEPRRGGITGLDCRARHGRFADDELHCVEPERDFAESDQGAAIMLAGGGDGCWRGGLAQIVLRKFAMSELRS